MCIPKQENREKVVEEVYNALKDGGLFIFTAHNRDDSGKHYQEWIEEKQKWDNNSQNKERIRTIWRQNSCRRNWRGNISSFPKC